MSCRREFTCPICRYTGPFADKEAEAGLRRYARCPQCGSLERHRLQFMVLERLAKTHDFASMSMLHFAPEPFFESYFRPQFGRYETADLTKRTVSLRADLRSLPLMDRSYDFVFASHVLEHIKEDGLAISEISRVLRPGGIALLHVPILGDKTVEYPEPNVHEFGHVRAPGVDYYERYRPYFERVETFDSHGFPPEHQLFIYEDRTRWPTTMPGRPTTAGDRHAAIVPVCWR